MDSRSSHALQRPPEDERRDSIRGLLVPVGVGRRVADERADAAAAASVGLADRLNGRLGIRSKTRDPVRVQALDDRLNMKALTTWSAKGWRKL